jgi:hypothetical protein
MLALLIVYIVVSTIHLKAILKGIRPIIVIIIVTSVLNLFFTKGTTAVSFWVITITWEGLRTAVFMVLRLVMLIVGTFLLTYTTSPIALTDGMEALMSPLKKLKLPVHELSMMMSIALRFIPTLIEETGKIMNAQKARGADFETGNLIQKARAMLPLLVPLFISFPPGRRAGRRHGEPLLSRRRRQDAHEGADHEAARLSGAGRCHAEPRRRYHDGGVRLMTALRDLYSLERIDGRKRQIIRRRVDHAEYCDAPDV